MAQVDYAHLVALLEDSVALALDMEHALEALAMDIRAGDTTVGPAGAAHLRALKRALDKQYLLLRDERQHAKERHYERDSHNGTGGH